MVPKMFEESLTIKFSFLIRYMSVFLEKIYTVKPIMYTQLQVRHFYFILKVQGPVVQSVVSLMSSLVVKMLTVLVSIISNS